MNALTRIVCILQKSNA